MNRRINTAPLPCAPRELFNTAQASRYLGEIVSASTLINWRSLGEGPPYIKIGGRVAYLRADLDNWLEDQAQESAREYFAK